MKTEKLTQLKAQAYDYLAAIQYAQNALAKLNAEILKLTKEAEAPKATPKLEIVEK